MSAPASKSIFHEAARGYNRRLLLYNLPIALYFFAVLASARLGYGLNYAVQSGNNVLVAFFYGGMLMGLPVLLAGWNLVKWFRRECDLESHPSFAFLREQGDIAAAARQVEASLESGPFIVKSDGVVITNDWFVLWGTWEFEVHRLKDAVWIYGTSLTKTHYGAVVSRTFGVHVCFANGKETGLTAPSEEEAGRIAGEIHERVKGARVGYSDELRSRWDNDRAEFLADLRARGEAAANGGAVCAQAPKPRKLSTRAYFIWFAALAAAAAGCYYVPLMMRLDVGTGAVIFLAVAGVALALAALTALLGGIVSASGMI